MWGTKAKVYHDDQEIGGDIRVENWAVRVFVWAELGFDKGGEDGKRGEMCWRWKSADFKLEKRLVKHLGKDVAPKSIRG